MGVLIAILACFLIIALCGFIAWLCALGDAKDEQVMIDLESKEVNVYRVNLRSKEIHRLDSDKLQCNLDLIKNYRDIPESELGFYIGNGFNGCRYCMKEVDTDIYNKKNEAEKNIQNAD